MPELLLFRRTTKASSTAYVRYMLPRLPYRTSGRATPDWPKLGECRSEAKCVSKWWLHLSDTVCSYRWTKIYEIRPFSACIQVRYIKYRNQSLPNFAVLMTKFAPGYFFSIAKEIRGADCCVPTLSLYSPLLISRSRSRALRVSLLSTFFLPFAIAIWALIRLPLLYNDIGTTVKPLLESAFKIS